jgi:hypothetical protein
MERSTMTLEFCDLVGMPEIARRSDVAYRTVQGWRSRHYARGDFPPPAVTLASGPVWSWPDVAAWLAIPRRRGRPRRITADWGVFDKAAALTRSIDVERLLSEAAGLTPGGFPKP